ncbi:NRPS-like enzyme [Penicillium angulare]|uniref:NRPS-like enzyme n=1 Tax=Penicillium angulare TaxID=116970 RepID=A0A9W9KRZ4_9EURO|nr:NRPS-like enzyme [Penicillium angulare]
MGSTYTEGRLSHVLLDEIAKESPDLLYCIHPKFHNGHLIWRNISFQMLAKAVDNLAWWIDEKLTGGDQRVLAYIGVNDLRYAVFMLACMKTGRAAFLISTRNAQTASKHLLVEMKCAVLIDGTETDTMQDMVDELVNLCADISLQSWPIGSLDDIFVSESSRPYLATAPTSFHEKENHPAIIIHSSGTTGLPKPVVLTHGYLATLDRMQMLPVPHGRQSAQLFLKYREQLRLMHGPLFHFVGIVCIFESIFFRTPFLLAPDRPLTTELFSQIMSSDPAPRWGLITPYILEQLGASEEGRNALSKLSALNYGGAPLSQATGQTLSSLLRLQTLMGSSETGYTPTLLCEDPEDWDYMEWNPSFELRMDFVGEGLWELTFPRPSSVQYHGIFHSHPHLELWRTGDLFRPHPTKPALWHYEGRGDDIIVLSNGEKLNPTDAEKLIQAHPLVKHAAIFGQDRFQTSLLIEPEWEHLTSGLELEKLRDALGPVIDKANLLLPAYGSVFGSHVIFASRDEPLSLSPKGTLRRREIARSYQAAFDALYEPQLAEGSNGDHWPKLHGSHMSDVEQWVQSCVVIILKREAIGLDDDIFNAGMDSLQIIRLVQVLQDTSKPFMPPQSSMRWTSSMVYASSTVRKLADTIYAQIHEYKVTTDDSKPEIWSREDMMTFSTWEQAQFLGSGGLTVALTGSTGELGSYLLHSLLQDPSVTRVYCLNRSSDAAARQLASFQRKKLATMWLTDTSRVQFWKATLDKESFGLESNSYGILRNDVDLVIHNAWPVNFNQPLSSFKPQLIGLRQLLRFVESSLRHIDFHFISSVSTVLGQSMSLESVILEELYKNTAALEQGYAESKAVAESLCGIFSKRTQSRIAIHRVGQLGGPSTSSAGIWNPRDWFPRLVKSSYTMKMIPNSLGPLRVDWVQIDAAANIITEIIQSHREDQSQDITVYHISNPHPTTWDTLVPQLAKACEADIVSLDKWILSLEKRQSDLQFVDTDFSETPALYLLSFFRMLADGQNITNPTLDVSNVRKHSATLSKLDPVDESVMKGWLQQLKTWIPDLDV